jgi:uroporphyrinogen-III synthase
MQQMAKPSATRLRRACCNKAHANYWMPSKRRMADSALHGIGVLVTRPALQATALVDAIEQRGGRAIRFPVIEVLPRDAEQLRIAAAAVAKPDIVIFVSSNAVRHGLRYADGAQTAVVGPATAAAVRDAGGDVHILPSAGFNSEGLLQHPALQEVAGQHILIVRGKSGRELLSSTLRDRGATVDTLAVYDRVQPTSDPTALAELEEQWHNGDIDVVTIMSIESLRNLLRLLPATIAAELDRALLVTAASRVTREVLKRYPAARTALASQADTDAMVRAIIHNIRDST